jgi:competence protein ComEA
MLKKLAQKVGLLNTELRVILFLIATFVLGLVAKNLINPDNEIVYKNIDYTHEDSLFKSANYRNSLKDSSLKDVDYKQEVLDFNSYSFYSSKKKNPPSKKSVNINKAGKKELIEIPGIGEKTAQNIINYRKIEGSFRVLEEIKNVKGIGDKKFEKIKQYVYIK